MTSAGMPYGLQAMLKEGYKHISGLSEAVMKNIEACQELSRITRSSMGPNGMNKIVINHLEKVFVTSDASVVVNELEVQHPAAKLLVMAAKAQEAEVGDGTNLVITLGGELLQKAAKLLKDGLTATEVADGYQRAANKALELLTAQIFPESENIDLRNIEAVKARLLAPLSAKQFGYEEALAQLVAEACVAVCPENPVNFSVDNVRTVKLPGSTLTDSVVVSGMVLRRDVEGSITSKTDCKVAVYAQGFDTSGTETKGTVLIHNADELMNYAKTEEARMDAIVKGLAAAGVQVIASGMAIGEMALHFLEKYDIMAIRIPSKFELRRFCRATGAVALVKVQPPVADEVGFIQDIRLQEIGGSKCLVVKQPPGVATLSTVVLRGATEGLMNDVERAVDDGVNTYKMLTKDPRAVAAGGGAELEVSRQLQDFGARQQGLQQYSIVAFAEALEVVPRVLADNSGLDATTVVSALQAAHSAGSTRAGIDVESGEAMDLCTKSLSDLYICKWWALKLAADAVCSVLRVDQIIMAKMAGGPAPPRQGGWDNEE